MRNLPKIVANTKVGKKVSVRIWRDKKSITKRLTLGRLESSEDFKTIALPHIKAGNIFQAIFAIGVFAGTISPTTPWGNLIV